MNRKLIFGILFFAWLAMIVLLSLWPSASVVIKQDVTRFRWDWLEHFLFYFILGFLFVFWRIHQDLSLPLAEKIIFTVAGIFISWLLEYIQGFIPGRAFTIHDMLSNLTGVIFGLLISYFLFARIFLKNYLKKKNPDS